MTFKYRVPRSNTAIEGIRKPVIATDAEQLVGTLQGKSVPKDEERFYNGVVKTRKARSYWVQFEIGRRGFPGYRTLDALVNTDFGYRAFEVDGAEFVHRGERKRAEDRLADFQRVEGLRHLGVYLRNGIEHVSDAKLQTQEDADRTADNLL